MTLLFAFFDSMYAISVTDSVKAPRLVASVRESFREPLFDFGPPEETSPFAGEGDGALETLIVPVDPGDPLAGLGDRARELAGAATGLSVRSTQEGLVISLADTVLFDQGGIELSDPSRKTVRELAALLVRLPNHLRIEGHTDREPVARGRFASNWGLSAAGIPPRRLSAAGFSAQRPLVSNGTPEGRRMNRRVDVVVLRARSAM